MPRLMDTPLEEWTSDQLKMEVVSELNDPYYIIKLDYGKEDIEYPITREEMIKWLRAKGGYR